MELSRFRVRILLQRQTRAGFEQDGHMGLFGFASDWVVDIFRVFEDLGIRVCRGLNGLVVVRERIRVRKWISI